MRRCRMGLCLLWELLAFQMSGQAWLGSLFTTDTMFPMSCLEDLSHLVCHVDEGTFYFVEAAAFQEQGQDCTASFFSLDLGHYGQSEIRLSVPMKTLWAHGYREQPWIYDFQFVENICVVSIQNLLLVFKSDRQGYRLDTLYACNNAKVCYYYQGDLYYLEEDHDIGYRWFRLANGKRKLLHELNYEAPHVVQAKPNCYLFHDDHYLYFLSTRYPLMCRFELDGKPVDTIRFELPCWHPFEDSYIENSLKVPYGVERIKATMKEIYYYSYPKQVFPIGGGYLLYYTQYDTVKGKSHLQFAIHDADGQTELYNRKPPAGWVYQDTLLPFTLLENRVGKASVSWNNRLVEILLADTISAVGKTDSAYRQARESYYREAAPVPSVKISSYKYALSPSIPVFYNERAKLQSLEDLPLGKHILLVHDELECSGCKKALLEWMDNLRADFQAVIVYPNFPGALTCYEWSMDVRKILKKNYQMLFLDREHWDRYPLFAKQAYRSFPGILLYEQGQTPIYFPLEEIFDDNMYANHFRDAFLKRVLDFFDHP